MRILIAEDEAVSRRALEAALQEWGYDVEMARNGDEAWNILRSDDSPQLAILDWIMPGMDGIEVCRMIREHCKTHPPYLILLTVKDRKEDIVAGLQAGANDYVSKPFHREELRARVDVGARMIEMRDDLTARVKELQDTLEHVRTLQKILPICAYCKKIRNDRNYWQQIESYLAAHADLKFSHSVCPECLEKHVQPQLDAIMRKEETGSGDEFFLR